jgi:hypothetical protein
MKTEIVSIFVKVEGHGHVAGAIGCAVPSGVAYVFVAAGWTELASSPSWSIVFTPECTPLPDPGDTVELKVEVPTKEATERLLEQYRCKIGGVIRQRPFKLAPALGDFFVSKDGAIVLHHIASLERFYDTPREAS